MNVIYKCIISLKRSLNFLKPKTGWDWALTIGAAIATGYALKVLVLDHMGATAQANFANSSNSVYPVHDTDVGNSMNSIAPVPPHELELPVSPHHMMHHHGHHHHHHGHHHHKHHGHHYGRSFPDYTDRANGLPTPFLEHNYPYDTFNKGATLANVIDKCAYIQTYDGNAFGSP